jgi:outer membrane protein, heavy metal efflux system
VYRFLFLVSCLACVPTERLIAQDRLSLSDAIAQALAAHPQLIVGDARIAAAEGLRRQAGLAPNPRLFVQLENTRFWDSPAFSFSHDTDDYAFLAQLVETGGKRARRVELAATGVGRVELERQALATQIAGRVSLAYWAAAGAYRVRDLLQQEGENFDRMVQYHRDRVREGSMAEVNLLRIQLERDRLSVSGRSAEQDAARATIVLFREMGKTEFSPVVLTDALEELKAVETGDTVQALDRRPEMKLARQAVEQARSNLRLQRANSKPDIDTQLGYKRTLGFDTLYAAVQIPLPVRNRNQGQIGAAEAELRAAEANLKATDAQVRADIEVAMKEYEARRRVITDILRPMQNEAGEVSRIAQGAYREGGFDLLRLLDSERARLETQLLYVRTLADYQQSVISLEIALGVLR